MKDTNAFNYLWMRIMVAIHGWHIKVGHFQVATNIILYKINDGPLFSRSLTRVRIDAHPNQNHISFVSQVGFYHHALNVESSHPTIFDIWN